MNKKIIYYCKFKNNEILQKYLFKKGYVWTDSKNKIKKEFSLLDDYVGINIDSGKLLYGDLVYYKTYKKYKKYKFINFDLLIKLKRISNE